MAASKLPEQTILGTLVEPINRVLRERGIDPAEILGSVAINPAMTEESDWRITNTSFNRLMRRCVEVTEDEAFGQKAMVAFDRPTRARAEPKRCIDAERP